MTHSEERTHWFKEGAIGLGVGMLYGTTSIAIGHPFDTLKTKMQAQAGYEKCGMIQTFSKTLRTQGLVGLYRGWIPPLCGSGIFRSSQFAVFEAVYTYFQNTSAAKDIPGTGGIQYRVLIGGFMSSTARALIECPLEYAKVSRQVGKSWHLRDMYTGFGVTWMRTLGLLCTYFILVDSGRRHFPEQFNRPIFGPFLISGVAATVSWWVVWPLENMKSQVQAHYGGSCIPLTQRIRQVVLGRGGFLGLYRGIAPGSIRSFIANGTSMVVMAFAQRKVTELGLRRQAA